MGLVKATAIAVAVTMPANRPDRTRNVRADFAMSMLPFRWPTDLSWGSLWGGR